MSRSSSKGKKTPEKEPKSAAASNKAEAEEHANRFPVEMIHDTLVKKFTTGTVKKEAAVFLTSVMEYLSTEILEMSANVARSRSNHDAGALKVTRADILEAVETDPDMKELITRAKQINSAGEK